LEVPVCHEASSGLRTEAAVSSKDAPPQFWHFKMHGIVVTVILLKTVTKAKENLYSYTSKQVMV